MCVRELFDRQLSVSRSTGVWPAGGNGYCLNTVHVHVLAQAPERLINACCLVSVTTAADPNDDHSATVLGGATATARSVAIATNETARSMACIATNATFNSYSNECASSHGNSKADETA